LGRIPASGEAGVWNAFAFHCCNSPDLPMQLLRAEILRRTAELALKYFSFLISHSLIFYTRA
jgi:hypothetical protein